MKAAFAWIGVGIAAVVAVVFFFRKGEGVTVAGSRPMDPNTDPGDGRLTGKIGEVERNTFSGLTFHVSVTNPSAIPKPAVVGLAFTPGGGFQFGVDPFKASTPTVVPARSTVELTFVDSDLSFSPITAGEVVLTIDGRIVDKA